MAFSSGGYGLTSRTALAVGLWAVLMIGIAFGVLPRGELSHSSLLVLSAFGCFALWTLASTLWAASPEAAFNELNRVSLYLAVLLVAVLGATRRAAGRYADGLCVGIVAIVLVSLASRCFPQHFSSGRLAVELPAETRLSFPVGYWNALGILASLAYPLCLRGAVLARAWLIRAAAVSALPLVTAVVYLTSSRGAAVTALAGIAVFVGATEGRWRAAGALAAGGAGSVLAVAFLLVRDTLVNGPLGSPVALTEGRSAALLLALCAVLAGAVFSAGTAILGRRSAPPRAVGRALVAALLLSVVIAGVASHPIARLTAFKRPPPSEQSRPVDFATTHFLSGGGGGRWQFWQAAVSEFRSAPVWGRGAGSYETWWAQHASFSYSVRNAHSLYLEVLGELGAAGFLLLCVTLASAVAVGCTRLRADRGERRVTRAALLAVAVAFLLGAAIDWVWQFAAIAAPAIAALGLAVSLSRSSLPRVREGGARGFGRAGIGGGIAILVVAWLLICAQAIPWLAAGKISDSKAAVRRGDPDVALANALDAKSLQPWAASPYVQLALVAEERGELRDARRWIGSAERRDSRDWRVWYLAARMQRESGEAAAAARSMATARSLNPRSPLFLPSP